MRVPTLTGYSEIGSFHKKGLEQSVRITGLEDHRPPSHSSKVVVASVHSGGL